MKNNYFLTYGFISQEDILSIKSQVELIFDLVLSERFSDFVGNYFLGNNELISRVTIESNYVEYLDDWKEDAYKESTILLKASFISIKVNDKEETIGAFCKKIESSFAGSHLIKLKELPMA